MSLEIATPLKSEIHKKNDIRFDSKFYMLENFFKKLEKKSNCKVDTLKNLEWKVSSGSYVNKYISSEEGTPYIRVGNIKPFSINEQHSSFVYVSKNLSEKIKVKEKDILLGRTQATTEKLGVASIADKNNKNYVLSQHVSKLYNSGNKISPYYLIAYLNSKFYKLQTDIASHGDTRVELTHSQIKKLKIFIPKSDIVQNIEKSVKKIINLNRLISFNLNRAKRHLRSYLNIKIKKNIKYFNVNLKTINDFGIWNAKSHMPNLVEVEKKIIKNFNTSSLGSIADIGTGFEPGSENYNTEKFKNKEDPAFIRTSDITNNDIDVFPDYFIPRNVLIKPKNKTEPGEIIFSKDGIIGETAIVSKFDNIILASGFAKIKLNKNGIKLNLTPEYLFALLSIIETGFLPASRRTVIAATIPHLRPERLKEIQIPILEKNKINQITRIIKASNRLKDLKKKLIIETVSVIDGFFI